MKFSRLIHMGGCMALILGLTVSAHAFTGTNDLVNTSVPGEGQEGRIELGVAKSFHSSDEYQLFMDAQLTRHIAYGLSVDSRYADGEGTELYPRHHLHFDFLSYRKNEFIHVLGMGAKNIGLNSSAVTSDRSNQADHRLYLGYSLFLDDSDFSAHYGFASIGNDNHTIKSYWALQYTYSEYSQFALEYDGYTYNFLVKAPFLDYYTAYLSYATEFQDTSEPYVSIGISFSEFLPSIVNEKSDAYTIVEPEEIQRASEKPLGSSSIDSTDLVTYHMQAGMKAFYEKDYEKALVEYQLVVSLAPDLSIAHERLGTIYFHLNKREQARQHYKSAYRLKPTPMLRKFIEEHFYD